MPEHFTLKQRFRHRRTVDSYERALSTLAVLVQGAGDQFFAGPALALNQHRRLGGRSPADEFEDFLHAPAAAYQLVIQSNAGPQFAVLLHQPLAVHHIIQSEASDSGHCGHHLQVAFVKLLRWISGIEVNGAQDFFRDHQRHAQQRPHLHVSQALSMAQAVIADYIADQHTGALGGGALHHCPAYANRMSRALHPVPGYGVVFPAAIKQKNGAAFRRHDFKNESQQLPLQRIELAGHPSHRRPGGHSFQIEVVRLIRAQQQERAEVPGFGKFHYAALRILAFIQQENKGGLSYPDLVSMFQLPFIDRHAVHHGAVTALEIANLKSALAGDKHAVAAGERSVRDG